MLRPLVLRPLVLRSPVGPAHSVEPRDSRAVKRSLDRLGLYRPPAEGITDVANSGMFAGLKAFQRRRGLPADGIAEPGGPLEAALNEDLLRAAKAQDTSARRETRTRTSFTRKKARPASAPAQERQQAPRGHLSAKPEKVGTGLVPEGGPHPIHRGLPSPGLNSAVTPEAFYKTIGFDPTGRGETRTALANPLKGVRAEAAADEAEAKTNRRVFDFTLPVGPGAINKPDAFRHALWIYKMTKEIGPEAAKEFGEAHERTVVNEPGERMMELYNNEIGRRLAMDTRNHTRPDEEVIMEALEKGLLRVTPFEFTKSRSAEPSSD